MRLRLNCECGIRLFDKDKVQILVLSRKYRCPKCFEIKETYIYKCGCEYEKLKGKKIKIRMVEMCEKHSEEVWRKYKK